MPFYSHFALILFTATLTATDFYGHSAFKTASFKESGRDDGHLATLLSTEVYSVVEYKLVPNDFYKDILCQTSMPFSERGRFSKQVRT
jgi:hypothetical protein